MVTTPNPTSIELSENGNTVQYVFDGTLWFESVPTAIDFGDITFSRTLQRVDNPSVSGNLVINDTRESTAQRWDLSVSAPNDIVNSDTGEILSAYFEYQLPNTDTPTKINSDSLVIYSANSSGKVDVSETWTSSENSEGLKLVVNTPKYITGNFESSILWLLSSTPKAE